MLLRENTEEFYGALAPIRWFAIIAYGLRPAPYLALRCLRQLCADDGDEFLLTKQVISNASYIDDFIFSIPDKETALQTRNQLIALMTKSGFSPRKWCNN